MASRLVALLALLVTLTATVTDHAGSIRIGSKLFTESRLLAEIMAQLIEARTDLEVERRLGLGGTQICFGALQSGEIDLYAEYTGTGWSVMLKRDEPVHDSLQAFLTVEAEFKERYGLQWLPPFGFNNSYALAMYGPAARQRGVTRVVEEEGGEFGAVARSFLLEKGLVERAADGPPQARGTGGGGFFTFLWGHRAETAGFLLEHILLTAMAVVRTATVISVGVATLAAFIGAGGLGDPIVTGLQLDDIDMILSGAIPAALLAIAVDFGLGRLELLLVPRGLRD